MKTMRRVLGTVVFDWPRFGRAMFSRNSWIHMANRDDSLSVSPEGDGVRCNWTHSRPLHLFRMFPASSGLLLRRALGSRPIRLLEVPTPSCEERPDVSFLIGHRGQERLELLLLTLKSIAGQRDVSFECIVVEQDVEPLIRDQLPSWVRYIHCPLPGSDDPYNRALGFNLAAREAKGEVLILHDNDMLLPVGYAAEALTLHRKGYDVAQLKRFIFYLDVSSTRRVLDTGSWNGLVTEQVIENLCGGGSLSVSSSFYKEIGGMDEAFIGWGGEDEEFWDRCQTGLVWEYAKFPLVHLWHAAQPAKYDRSNPTLALLNQKLAVPAADRIRDLKETQRVSR